MDVNFDCGQQNGLEYLGKFCDRAYDMERAAGCCGFSGGVQLSVALATHVDRIFGFVREIRRRCRQCKGTVRCWFSRERVLPLQPWADGGRRDVL